MSPTNSQILFTMFTMFRPQLMVISLVSFAILSYCIRATSTTAIMKTFKPLKPIPPVPVGPDPDKEPTERIEFLNLGRSNFVMGWPSVGGIIIAESVQSVELDFLGIDRFMPAQRSYNQTEEDAFCRKLRLVGGKWWESYWDYRLVENKSRQMTMEESQVLYLGRPKDGGVWVIRLPNRNRFWYGFDRHRNAHTMEERVRRRALFTPVCRTLLIDILYSQCKALELSGGTFFEDPEECEFVAPFLRGFGEDKPKSRYPNDEL